MSDTTNAFFHQEQLAAAFMQCTSKALGDQQIDPQERTWLETLVSTGSANGSARVDLLEVDDGSDPPALTGTLMFSDPASDSRRVFLQGPLFGLEAFDDRAAVDEALRQRITQHYTIVETTQVHGSPFAAQMTEYLDRRARRLARMAKELSRLPRLDAQIGDSTTTAGSAAGYKRALAQFWKTTTAGSKHLHQLASKAFAEGFYQDLAQARQGNGENLLQLDPAWPPLHAPALSCEKIQVRLGNEWVELAGAFTFGLKTQVQILLYWPETGLQALPSRGALNACLDPLAPPAALPLQYWEQWRQNASRSYRLHTIEQSVFVDRVDSIVALQQLNLVHALSTASNDISVAQVVVDDALRVNTLIDRRLRTLDPTHRWARHVSTPEPQAPEKGPVFKPLLEGIHRLVSLASERDDVYRASPGARSLARSLLKPALAVFDGNHEPETLLLHSAGVPSPGTSPSRDLNLIDVLFQRVSGFTSTPIGADDWLTGAGHKRLPSLPPAAIEQALANAQQAFVARFTEQLDGIDRLSLCLDNRWSSVPGVLRRNLEDGIRLEMAFHSYFETTPPALVERLKQVLDKPLAQQRQALGAQMARAFGLQLNHSAGTPAVRLDLALVIDQPGSADQAILFWSPVEGLKAYSTVAQLGSELLRNLTTGQRRDAWYKLLPAGQQAVWKPLFEAPLSALLTVTTWAIPDNVIQVMQATTQRHQQLNTQHALQLVRAGHYRAELFEAFLDIPRRQDLIADYFEEQSFRFADLHTREVLPDWLNLASDPDVATFALLLQRNLDTLKPEHSYLFDIPAIHGFARKPLRERLATDFAGRGLDPDQITITLKSFTAAPVPAGELPSGVPAATTQVKHSLTQAAINHFNDALGAVMTISLNDGSALPAGLTPDYVRQVIRELDLGDKYLTLLNRELNPSDKKFALRKERFSAMVSSMLRLATFQHVLQDDWGRSAMHVVSAILDMPDGLARQPVDGHPIIFSRLQLRATNDLAPDTVNCAYLIGPDQPSQGPLLLFLAYATEDSLRLYNSRTELLAAIHTEPKLQAQILARLNAHARRTYDHGGFIEPHLPWSTESSFDIRPQTPDPAQLCVQAITGNTLEVLLQDNIAYLQASAKTQAVTNAQAQWKSFTELMTLGVEQASLFLPGRLSALASLWQAKTWASAATDAASHNQWGKSLSEFAAAMASLAGTRLAEEPAAATGKVPVVLAPVNPLRSYEVREVSLATLTKDLALPVYRKGTTAYAAVEGRVYQVYQQGEHWYIFTGRSRRGPKIRLDAERHWVLDQKLGLRGGGIGNSKFDAYEVEAADVDAELETRFTVTASGMAQIKAADRIKARQIRSAHALALRYLRTCLRNLDADRSAGFIPHTSDVILQGMFGFPATPTVVAQRLRNMVSDIYVDMLSLSPKTSPRFVAGTLKHSDDRSDAFVYRQDPKRRIFLPESFFSFVFPAYTTMEAQIMGFDSRTHFQATVLIHELSHLNNRTADIAYLGAAAPFVDLISEQFPEARADLLDNQSRGLSSHTPRDRLFKLRDHGTLRDFTANDSSAYSRILKVTATRNLEDARDAFYNDPIKRTEILLANADTIALLVTKLGRVPFNSTAV